MNKYKANNTCQHAWQHFYCDIHLNDFITFVFINVSIVFIIIIRKLLCGFYFSLNNVFMENSVRNLLFVMLTTDL